MTSHIDTSVLEGLAYCVGTLEGLGSEEARNALKAKPTIFLIGTVALAGIASATGYLPPIVGETIGWGVTVGVMSGLAKNVMRLVWAKIFPPTDINAVYNTSVNITRSIVRTPFLYTVILAPGSEILTKQIVFPYTKGIITIFGGALPTANTYGSLLISMLEGNEAASLEDKWAWLAQVAASQLVFFPAYLKGGLPVSILAHASFSLASSVTERLLFNWLQDVRLKIFQDNMDSLQ